MTCETRLIVTNVQVIGGAPILASPIVDHALYTVGAVSLMTGLTKDHVRMLLSRYPEHFDPPRHQATIVNGKQGARWPRRLLSARDVATIRSMYPVK